MKFDEAMQALSEQGTEQNRRIFRNHGAREPLFGVSIAALGALTKRIKKDQPLAEGLYASGVYDAMYLATMIADPAQMSESDFERWMDGAYCHGLSDAVAGVLSESEVAEGIADRWIQSGEELRMAAGWTCYDWLLCTRPDGAFDQEKLSAMLYAVEDGIHRQPNWTRYAMNNFIIALGISYVPLHAQALRAAEVVGKVTVNMGKTSCKTPLASAYIQKAVTQGRLGYKRKSKRC